MAAVVALVLVLVLANLPGGDSPDNDPVAGADASDRSAPGGQSEDPSDSPDGEGRFGDPDRTDIAFRPDSIAVDGSSVWVSDWACGVVVRIDRATEEVVGVIDLGGAASGVAVAGGSVWVGNRDLSRIVRLNPETITIESIVDLPGYALGLAADGTTIWATDPLNNVVHRVDATTGALLDTTPVGESPHHIAIGNNDVWVTNSGAATVTRLEVSGTGSAPALDGVIEVGNYPLHVEVGDGNAWITNGADASVTRIDTATGATLAVIPVGFFPHALALAGGSVWVGTEAGELWRIDPATDTAAIVPRARFSSIDMAVDNDEIWVADAGASMVVRFDAAAGEVASTIDLLEYGDCESFRGDAVIPPLTEAVATRP